MKFLGIEIRRGCADCERLERENEALRGQMALLAEAQMGHLDAIRELRAWRERVLSSRKADAAFLTGLADLQKVEAGR